MEDQQTSHIYQTPAVDSPVIQAAIIRESQCHGYKTENYLSAPGFQVHEARYTVRCDEHVSEEASFGTDCQNEESPIKSDLNLALLLHRLNYI